MDRLTGDFKGASMFATAADSRIHSRLRQYEDTNLAPADIAAMREELAGVRAENAAMRYDLETQGSCAVCKNSSHNGGECPSFIDCGNPDSPMGEMFHNEWRGICAKNNEAARAAMEKEGPHGTHE